MDLRALSDDKTSSSEAQQMHPDDAQRDSPRASAVSPAHPPSFIMIYIAERRDLQSLKRGVGVKGLTLDLFVS